MTTHRRQWLKPTVGMIATLPLYLFFAYIFALGLMQFFELHLLGIVSVAIIGYALPFVVGGVISWRVIQAIRAFQEGLREGRRRNLTSR